MLILNWYLLNGMENVKVRFQWYLPQFWGHIPRKSYYISVKIFYSFFTESNKWPLYAFKTSLDWSSFRPFTKQYFVFQNKESKRASLMAQWLRISLPMQGTRVRALVREDPTCRGAAKPVSHNYWACALEPASHNHWSPHA